MSRSSSINAVKSMSPFQPHSNLTHPNIPHILLLYCTGTVETCQRGRRKIFHIFSGVTSVFPDSYEFLLTPPNLRGILKCALAPAVPPQRSRLVGSVGTVSVLGSHFL